MKILQFKPTVRLESGGVTRAVLDLAAALAARGHEVCLATADATDVPADWDGTNDRPRTVVVQRGGNPARPFAREARQALESEIARADVVHLHVLWDPACAAIASWAKRAGVPYVVTSHGMLDDWCMEQKTAKKRLYLATIGRGLLRDAAAVHCTAEAEREQSSKWFPGTKGIVIPYFFDLEPYRELPGPGPAQAMFPQLDTDLPKVLFLSRLHYKKGVERLLDAAAELIRRGVEFRLLLAGSGDPTYEATLRRRVESLGLGEVAHFLGFVSGIEKLSLYQASDLFVLPTSQENFGFVTVEALACGTPVITTRGVDIWRELEHRCGAMIVDPHASAVAAAIQNSWKDSQAATKAMEVGRPGVFSWLQPDTIADAFDDMYQSVASGG